MNSCDSLPLYQSLDLLIGTSSKPIITADTFSLCLELNSIHCFNNRMAWNLLALFRMYLTDLEAVICCKFLSKATIQSAVSLWLCFLLISLLFTLYFIPSTETLFLCSPCLLSPSFWTIAFLQTLSSFHCSSEPCSFVWFTTISLLFLGMFWFRSWSSLCHELIQNLEKWWFAQLRDFWICPGRAR